MKDINLDVKKGDRVLIKGRTGAGKTTLFKILTGVYPHCFISPYNHLISFSSQHPLKLPMASLLENIDPYSILDSVPSSIASRVREHMRQLGEKEKFGYEDQVKINNIRAFLYGWNGLAIYDEPNIVLN